MKKRNLIVLCVAVCFLGVIFFSKGLMPSKTITELNQPYNGSVLKITATEIKAVESPSGTNDEIIIGVKFVVENVSRKEWQQTRQGMTAYVDDVAQPQKYDTKHFSDSLEGRIAPGKFTIGYYCVQASKNAKLIEIHFDEVSNKKTAIFILDIPSIEQDT